MNKVDTDAIKDLALAMPDRFEISYLDWLETKKSSSLTTPETEDSDQDFINEFYNLRGGFKEYVFNNLDRLKSASERVRQEAISKWNRSKLCEGPCPLEENIEDNKPEIVMPEKKMFRCPKDSALITVEVCHQGCDRIAACNSNQEFIGNE